MTAPSLPLPAATVRAVIADRLPDMTVYVDVPRDPAAEYVRIVSRGGTRKHHGELQNRVCQVIGYGPTSARAAMACERAVTALVGAGMDPAETRIRGVTVAAEAADYADPDTGAPRATSTVVVLMRGTTP